MHLSTPWEQEFFYPPHKSIISAILGINIPISNIVLQMLLKNNFRAPLSKMKIEIRRKGIGIPHDKEA
jgi:hypothetical protein